MTAESICFTFTILLVTVCVVVGGLSPEIAYRMLDRLEGDQTQEGEL